MDITPSIPGNKTVVNSYGPGRFKVSHQDYDDTSLALLPESVQTWDVKDIQDLTVESLSIFTKLDEPIEVLLIGCGERMQLIPSAIKQAMRENGIAIEPMETGAACRTFNILMSEGRRAGAAVIALPNQT
ncbi:Mth938-like domain-containing protein [Aestuariispira insulae]|uniref:NADH dehydrogenase [ubiquinone] 1 alpha subcomplex assembly factor 3 n=1 Tax=Aestuariispira insulae TaxID=1461337 RepID=A0A3D9HNG7_9PROT|nr:Mth938-like domain-containing protein [Aestuariispira insulae]RED51047.1 uncharacterized protein DFP90_104325 [Aestuariispira insulae]